MPTVRSVLHRVLCNNKTVRNAPEYEFWVQWSGCGAFVANNFEATLFGELVRYWHLFDQFCIDFRAVTKLSETPQNVSFGSNGVDPSGSRAFIAKNFEATLFSKLVR
jgi:hypothetical protein